MTRAELIDKMIHPSATDAQRNAITGVLQHVPLRALEICERDGTQIRALQRNEQFRDVSRALRRLTSGVDDWPAPPAGLFVLEERTVYLRSISAMTVAHEFGHALDAALGGGVYASGVDPTIRRAYKDARGYVTPYAASALDEFYAEAFRAYVGQNDPRSPWPRATRQRLQEFSPSLVEYFDRQIGPQAALDLTRDRADAFAGPPAGAQTPAQERGGDVAAEAIGGEALGSRSESTPVAETVATAEVAAPDKVGEAPASRNEKRNDFYRELTADVIGLIEKGGLPAWQRFWTETAINGMPRNGTTNQQYRGGNTLRLAVTAQMNGWSDSRWMTVKQANSRGWSVRAGERGTHIEVWKWRESFRDRDGNDVQPKVAREKLAQPGGEKEICEQRSAIHRLFTVFNASQVDVPVDRDGVIVKVPLSEFDPQVSEINAWDVEKRVETIVAAVGVNVQHVAQDRAFYTPMIDTITMPMKPQFASASDYSDVLLHETGHSTGHPLRLGRETLRGAISGDRASYAREELRAELASFFMAAELGLPHNVERHAAYLENWVSDLRNNHMEIYAAARDAQAAHDFMLTKEAEYLKERGLDLPAGSLDAAAGREAEVGLRAARVALLLDSTLLGRDVFDHAVERFGTVVEHAYGTLVTVRWEDGETQVVDVHKDDYVRLVDVEDALTPSVSMLVQPSYNGDPVDRALLHAVRSTDVPDFPDAMRARLAALGISVPADAALDRGVISAIFEAAEAAPPGEVPVEVWDRAFSSRARAVLLESGAVLEPQPERATELLREFWYPDVIDAARAAKFKDDTFSLEIVASYAWPDTVSAVEDAIARTRASSDRVRQLYAEDLAEDLPAMRRMHAFTVAARAALDPVLGEYNARLAQLERRATLTGIATDAQVERDVFTFMKQRVTLALAPVAQRYGAHPPSALEALSRAGVAALYESRTHGRDYALIRIGERVGHLAIASTVSALVLPSAERDVRRGQFVDRLREVGDDRTRIWSLAMNEIRSLKTTYDITTVRRMMTDYRKAVVDALGPDHPALPYLRSYRADEREVNAETRERIAQRLRDLRPVDPEIVAERAEMLMRSSAWPDRVAGVVIATGTRVPEVALLSDFDMVQGASDRIRFAGGIRGNTAAREIPTLVDAALVIRTVEALRAQKPLDGRTAAQISASHGKPVSAAASNALGEKFTATELRDVYATVAHEWHGTPAESITSYQARILGHDATDAVTAMSHLRFYPTGKEMEACEQMERSRLELIAVTRARLNTDSWSPEAREKITRELEQLQHLSFDIREPAAPAIGRQSDAAATDMVRLKSLVAIGEQLYEDLRIARSIQSETGGSRDIDAEHQLRSNVSHLESVRATLKRLQLRDVAAVNVDERGAYAAVGAAAQAHGIYAPWLAQELQLSERIHAQRTPEAPALEQSHRVAFVWNPVGREAEVRSIVLSARDSEQARERFLNADLLDPKLESDMLVPVGAIAGDIVAVALVDEREPQRAPAPSIALDAPRADVTKASPLLSAASPGPSLPGAAASVPSSSALQTITPPRENSMTGSEHRVVLIGSPAIGSLKEYDNVAKIGLRQSVSRMENGERVFDNKFYDLAAFRDDGKALAAAAKDVGKDSLLRVEALVHTSTYNGKRGTEFLVSSAEVVAKADIAKDAPKNEMIARGVVLDAPQKNERGTVAWTTIGVDREGKDGATVRDQFRAKAFGANVASLMALRVGDSQEFAGKVEVEQARDGGHKDPVLLIARHGADIGLKQRLGLDAPAQAQEQQIAPPAQQRGEGIEGAAPANREPEPVAAPAPTSREQDGRYDSELAATREGLHAAELRREAASQVTLIDRDQHKGRVVDRESLPYAMTGPIIGQSPDGSKLYMDLGRDDLLEFDRATFGDVTPEVGKSYTISQEQGREVATIREPQIDRGQEIEQTREAGHAIA